MLKTLDMAEGMEDAIFVPAHAEAVFLDHMSLWQRRKDCRLY